MASKTLACNTIRNLSGKLFKKPNDLAPIYKMVELANNDAISFGWRERAALTACWHIARRRLRLSGRGSR